MTMRDGYEFNQETGHDIDGRNLWSGRATLQYKPTENLKADLVWEHFYENDDRARSTKQLCEKDPGPSVVDGPAGPQMPNAANFGSEWLSQGCLPGSLYAKSAFGTPNAGAIPFVSALELLTPYVKPGNRSLCRRDAIAEFARHRFPARSEIQSKERHGRIQRRLFDQPASHAHLADRLQQGQSVLDGRLQPLSPPRRSSSIPASARWWARTASIAIRSSAAPTRWWARMCRRKNPSSSTRSFG